MDKFEQMVETIEEAEDMVECKECFDLFPKAECTKMDHGYICPTCGREQQSQDFSDVSFTDITTNLYDQEFPDVREYDSEFGPEMEERQKEYHVDDIVDALLKDEYDAIESYELADEMIQEADVEEDMKDDLLDAIEHIKKEEEEHIDEINAAAGRVEADPEDEDKKDDDSEEDSESEDEDDDKDEDDKDSDKEDDDKDEDEDDEDDKEKNEDLTEAAPSPEMVEGEEILDEKKESVFDKIWKPVNESLWICKFKDAEIGKVSAETEEEALEKMQKEYPEHNYGEYDGCFEVCQETETDSEELVEAKLEEGPLRSLKKATLDNIFVNGYVVRVIDPAKAKVKDTTAIKEEKKYKDLKSAEAAAKAFSGKMYPTMAVYIYSQPLQQSDIETYPEQLQELINTKGMIIAKWTKGKPEAKFDKTSELSKQIKNISSADKKISKLDSKAGTVDDVEDPMAAGSAEEAETADNPIDSIEKTTEPKDETSATETPDASEGVIEEQPKESPKKTVANQKIKTALKNSGMSTAEINKLFKNGTLPIIRKALIGEGLTLDDIEDEAVEETVDCVWCNHTLPRSDCRKEVDMGWLCDKCERAINSRGETLTFEEKLDIDLSNCVDSSDIEVYGLEPAGENTYRAVLAKRYENVSLKGFDEEQAIVDEMREDGNVFEFTFAKDGTPCLGAWNTNVLHELGPCNIIFDDERYDQAVASVFDRVASARKNLK